MDTTGSRKKTKTKSGVNLIKLQLALASANVRHVTIFTSKLNNSLQMQTICISEDFHYYQHVWIETQKCKLLHSLPLIKCQAKRLVRRLMKNLCFVFVLQSIYLTKPDSNRSANVRMKITLLCYENQCKANCTISERGNVWREISQL